MKKLLIVLSSVRKNRVADQALELTKQQLSDYKDFDVDVADFRATPLPFYDNELSTSAPEFSPEDENVKKWTEKVKNADAVLILAAEYNYSYTAAIKNAVDWVPGSIWEGKKIGFVGYGWSGGARAIANLRNLFTDFLKASPSEVEANLRFTKDIGVDGSVIDANTVKESITKVLNDLK